MLAAALHRDPTVLEAIYARRAVRTYTGEPLDEMTVRALLRAAVHAPTACDLEPWAFVIIQDRELLHRISQRAKAAAADRIDGAQQLVRRPSGQRVPPAQLGDAAFDVFYNAGTLIVVCARPFGPLVAADCWLAAENLMLAATALGLGSCPIGFALPALEQSDLKIELSIPPEVVPVVPIVVGYPAGVVNHVTRHDPEILAWHGA